MLLVNFIILSVSGMISGDARNRAWVSQLCKAYNKLINRTTQKGWLDKCMQKGMTAVETSNKISALLASIQNNNTFIIMAHRLICLLAM